MIALLCADSCKCCGIYTRRLSLRVKLRICEMSPLLAGDSLSSRSSSEATADAETEAEAEVGTYLEGSYSEILLCGAS